MPAHQRGIELTTRAPPGSSPLAVRMIVSSHSNASPGASPPSDARSVGNDRSPFCSVGSSRSKRSIAAARIAAALAQLGQHALGADLVQLVEGDEEPTLGVLVDAAVPGDQAQDPTVVDAYGEVREAQARPAPRTSPGSARSRPPAEATPEHVDVALGELPVPALLRPLGAPHRPDLDGLERIGQLARGSRRSSAPAAP